MRLKACLLALILSFPSLCFAADWLQASVGSSGSISYIDMASLEKDEQGHVRYWEKFIYKNEKHIKGGTFLQKGQPVWYSLGYFKEDCNSGDYAGPTSIIYYGLKGEVIYNFANMNEWVWGKRGPETMGENVHETVCALSRAKYPTEASQGTSAVKGY